MCVSFLFPFGHVFQFIYLILKAPTIVRAVSVSIWDPNVRPRIHDPTQRIVCTPLFRAQILELPASSVHMSLDSRAAVDTNTTAITTK